MTFSNAWPPNGDHIGRALEKAAAFETLKLKLEGRRELSQIEIAKGLVCWKG